ncbi:MAG: Thymidine kinase [Microgenomates group bacterium GW2011_GWC1_44_37]|uniref:thymidine kinase n=1 Tax=Candidatus Collierbacteria bacterium GW2011_GWB2_44_22 TaxID=1618387 RepID=A0A0G1HY91_9BACT|nr:MAG: Thymidine kinase [Candidatus Collierbacteria bacterium GW2011_GWA2_44_13]KKT51925.1 MAG: Thymidine kinase [Candidatus Collierbacteria bacterium GW2011_GWB2_44_22]KKT61221.1 MAG: Thymidine kinase [Candidatus Collierbacteria bacterium GW2011_GWD1_44_27]KKT64259.1 MAG: Thymidine kinase [Candidatus Collierbacteria bacterium GW2011_GWC2_44_30]KKT68397.1 MAG: Thymidine kinase [Microgenomates group bacterium GW2011_GWC1_44_37]KKT87787.1 MAG: Thymidine kinase [Candidatus Collierbacteria bacter
MCNDYISIITQYTHPLLTRQNNYRSKTYPSKQKLCFSRTLDIITQMQSSTSLSGQSLYSFVENKATLLSSLLYKKIKKSPIEHSHFSIIVGSSCSGKSLTLIKLYWSLNKKPPENKQVIFCQPMVDRRDVVKDYIRSRTKEGIPAISFSSKSQIEKIFHDYDVVIVDEIQLTPHDLQSYFLKELHLFLDRGGFFVCAGLDYNSLGGEFIFPALLKTRAHKIHHLYSLCSMCGKPADRFDQRLINGIPANVNMPDFVGPTDSITYEPRCSDCLIVKK